MKRRKALRNLALGASGIAIGSQACTSPVEAVKETVNKTTMEKKEPPITFKGNVNHSVCRWCYNSIPLEQFIEGVKEIGGIKSVEITGPDDWPILIKNGLTAAVGTGQIANIVEGWNDPKNHEKMTAPYLKLIEQAADAGLPNVIVFSGNRNGMDDMVGLENCAVGLDSIVKYAEKLGITLVMELLNSKVNHKDYMLSLIHISEPTRPY